MWYGLGSGQSGGIRELLLVVVATLASVRVSHGTAGGCDCPVPGWEQRAHLNVGLPNIQCSIQLLCATGQEHPSKAEMMPLAPAATVGLIFAPLLQASC